MIKRKIILIVIGIISIATTCMILSFNNLSNKNDFTKTEEKKSKLKKTPCLETILYSHQLNDSLHHYLEQSYLGGIKPIMKYAIEINENVKAGKLILIKNTNHYLIDSLKYSYPFLIPKAQNLLNLIGEKFQSKINNTNLKDTKFVVTSLLRTKSSTTRLRRKNKNAIRYSAHLHGTTFDITYEDFENQKNITPIEKESLKEILANILFELRKQKKCWVTYEYFQNCFHIVSR